jgi:hypothetical protein
LAAAAAANIDLSSIAATKTGTAVDVFVYDTRNDSDGGAWRHRTQHTSWYAEASSASRDPNTRSYDGDDPSLPMWMVIPDGGHIVGNTSVTAFNSVILIGTSLYGVVLIDFTEDAISRHRSTVSASGFKLPSRLISDRSVSATAFDGLLPAIVNSTVNDVAMTVLPGAPTDPATGIAVPTIALATDGGVSVIRDDGTVVDSADTYAVNAVNFDANNFIWYPRDGGSTQRYSQTYAADGFQGRNWQLGFPTAFASSSTITLADSTKDTVVLGAANTSQGISQLHVDASSESNSMVAYTTSSYATGWMNGDIKLAALADTTAGTLSGSELVTASSDLVPQFYPAEWTLGVGSASVTGISSGDRLWLFGAANANLLPAGTYNVSYTIGAGTYLMTGLYFDGAYISTSSTAGDKSVTFTTDGTKQSPFFFLNANGNLYLTNVSVRLADPDRSVNGNGLAVHGSITKAPVATGADVVAYSGFGSSNYLEQPYNSALNFGTGNFCVMGWLKVGSIFAYDSVLERSDGTNLDFRVLHLGTNYLRLEVGGGGSIDSTTAIDQSQWLHFAVGRWGGSLQMYINGTSEATTANSADIDLSTSPVLRVGEGRSATARVFKGSLALLRISATAPTADQIKKIYEDEKVLFQENAKATLTGNSDAVTALAHDPVTDLLHVGTLSGRSVFQGLRRVEESTGADSQSLAAISAVDGLVVEGK